MFHPYSRVFHQDGYFITVDHFQHSVCMTAADMPLKLFPDLLSAFDEVYRCCVPVIRPHLSFPSCVYRNNVK